MMSANSLRNELDCLAFQRLEELEREMIEGTRHAGIGSDVPLIAIKQITLQFLQSPLLPIQAKQFQE
jgi:hypothetical protein